MMNKAYLLLGSNEGDRIGWFHKALEILEKTAGNITAKSSLYETAAWGIEEQPDFLNMAVCLETTLEAPTLLRTILETEEILGRHRTVKWGQRTIDIDILFYNQDVITLPQLTIPHPFIQKRRFALVPLNEIAPMYTHPILHKTITTLLNECTDGLEVHLYSLDNR